MRIFLDDERSPPIDEPDWQVVRTAEALVDLVSRHAEIVVEISFDNDLQQEMEGRHALARIVGDARHPAMHLPALRRITLHSANIVAVQAMEGLIESSIRAGQMPHIEVRRRSALLYPYRLSHPIAE